eukprot:TRINITY_DN2879_c0_g1_i1.p1 TRINITY_DN2879_c0_g1~~TRINITY_DN2879_c0_g1_i1.p1  ORF type:complete len:232 (+),score=21.71 TRINITY_DN2879_c0_g1_i1:412-1107(+)
MKKIKKLDLTSFLNFYKLLQQYLYSFHKMIRNNPKVNNPKNIIEIIQGNKMVCQFNVGKISSSFNPIIVNCKQNIIFKKISNFYFLNFSFEISGYYKAPKYFTKQNKQINMKTKEMYKLLNRIYITTITFKIALQQESIIFKQFVSQNYNSKRPNTLIIISQKSKIQRTIKIPQQKQIQTKCKVPRIMHKCKGRINFRIENMIRVGFLVQIYSGYSFSLRKSIFDFPCTLR